MATTKQDLLKMIDSMPDDITIDDVMAELYFREQVDAGLAELEDGEGLSHDDVKEKHSQWLET